MENTEILQSRGVCVKHDKYSFEIWRIKYRRGVCKYHLRCTFLPKDFSFLRPAFLFSHSRCQPNGSFYKSTLLLTFKGIFDKI
jgi:hypothetical protein